HGVHQVVPPHRRARRRGPHPRRGPAPVAGPPGVPGRGGRQLMRDVAIIGFAQTPHVRREAQLNEVEMLMPVLDEVRERANVTKDDIGFTCSGSTDYLAGVSFSFVMTLDGVGPWPPIQESHVEMDGAFALYEAWVKLQLGEVDCALVYAYGKRSEERRVGT